MEWNEWSGMNNWLQRRIVKIIDKIEEIYSQYFKVKMEWNEWSGMNNWLQR